MTATLTLTFNLDTKVGRITDTTDYTELGINLSQLGAKGLGEVTFNGDVIVSKLTIGSPLINLSAGATFFEFPLELDNNGNVANGTYGVSYINRFAIAQPAQVDFTVTSATTLVTDGGGYLVNVLEAGNELTLDDASTVTVVSTEAVSSNVLITVDGGLTTQGAFNFDVQNDTFSDIYTSKGCVKITASVTGISDCDSGDNGTFTGQDTTNLSTVTLVEREMIISPPSWATEIDAVTTEDQSYTINRLATGTWTIVLTNTVTQTQDDGLILQYDVTASDEFVVTCSGTLCGLNACIENLRAAHSAALKAGKVSPYQRFVDDVSLLYIQAVNYKECGESDKYSETVQAIEDALDASGCECACCDGDELRYIYNTSSETQAQIDVIEAQVDNLMNVNYNKVLFDTPLIIVDAPSDYITPPTGPYLTFDDVSAITIPKTYFDTDPNGVAKKFVMIEMTTYSSNQRTPFITSEVGRIYEVPTVRGTAATVRHRIKLSTLKVSSLTTCIVAGESFEVDNDDSTNTADNYFNPNNYGDLWDLNEDLVLTFDISGGTTGNAITELKITAYGYE